MPSAPQSDDASAGNLVVGIGASAGGLAAFKAFLANTPADTGIAFVLVQHLDPHHKSLLVELLGAGAVIPVMEAADGMAVRKNCVYVIPPDATLTIENGLLSVVSPAPPRELRRPIDTSPRLPNTVATRPLASSYPVLAVMGRSACARSRSTAG